MDKVAESTLSHMCLSLMASSCLAGKQQERDDEAALAHFGMGILALPAAEEVLATSAKDSSMSRSAILSMSFRMYCMWLTSSSRRDSTTYNKGGKGRKQQ